VTTNAEALALIRLFVQLLATALFVLSSRPRQPGAGSAPS